MTRATMPATDVYATRRLTTETWADFASLVEASSGVWGGCWCIGFHAGWVQYGPPAEVASVKNPRAYERGLVDLPERRIGCVFTGSRFRRRGVARAGLTAVLSEIEKAGGGVVEAYPEQLDDRPPQRGPISTPDLTACSQNSASGAIGGSRSGAG